MSDEAPINVKHELEAAQERLPINIDSSSMPIDFTLRAMALTIAQRHVSDTCIKEGNLYQQIKMDNKLGETVSVKHVINAALVFERYLWGEWSKGIAENALAATETKVADYLERQLRGEGEPDIADDDPTRAHGGGE